MHRDLKPCNILVDTNCNIKVADFGMARTQTENKIINCNEMTDYIATRWYRAPEILLGSSHYSKSVDLWSIGCILGEMLLGRALFPGSSTLDQI